VPSGVKIIDPVYIEDSVTLQDSEIGPNVAIERDSTIVGSEIRNSILGRGVRVKRALVHGSLVGDDQVITEQELVNAVMDGGEIAAAR
jgi:glucose-1-phosphate thymidylyltransferase